MAAFTSIIAGIGLATSLGGMAMNAVAGSEAAEAQGRVAANQQVIANLQAQNVDTQEQQLALQSHQQRLGIQTNKEVIEMQRQAEGIRLQAAELDATRRRRETIRAQIVARSSALATATAQGAAGEGGSSVSNAYGDISGRTGVNMTGITQNLNIAQRLFDVNSTITSIYLNAQDINSNYVTQSEELQKKQLGTQRQIYQLGGNINEAQRDVASAQSNAAFGAGISSLGGSLVANSATIGRIGSYFTGGSQPLPTYGGFVNSIGSNGIY